MLSEEEYNKIIAWIERNKKPNGYITELGLIHLINKLRSKREGN